jgi:hypothetical protein
MGPLGNCPAYPWVKTALLEGDSFPPSLTFSEISSIERGQQVPNSKISSNFDAFFLQYAHL